MHKLNSREVNRHIERSVASEAISRSDVSPSLAHCDLISWDKKVPHFPNRNGGDLYVYPGFILYRASEQAFALLDSREVKLRFATSRFIEDGPVPSDTTIIGEAWAKSNKDGGPDRRYRNNYQIPIVIYGVLEFSSKSGLQEAYYVSKAEATQRFSEDWLSFSQSFDSLGVAEPNQSPFGAPELIKSLFVCQKASEQEYIPETPKAPLRQAGLSTCWIRSG